MPDKTFSLTGETGCIGSVVVRHLIEHTACDVVVLDKLAYAGNLHSLKSLSMFCASKLAGDLTINQSGVCHLISRTSWAYADRAITA